MGFKGMSKERQLEIASIGGKAAHRSGRAHRFTREEAQAAGRKGGLKTSQNKAHMSAIGKKGGTVGGWKARKRNASTDTLHGQTPQV